MNLPLAEIAETVAPRRPRGPLDRTSWAAPIDLSRRVAPPTIIIIVLPPNCPELNPVENVWQFMRNNWLSNRAFKAYDDFVNHCCEAWNKLVE